ARCGAWVPRAPKFRSRSPAKASCCACSYAPPTAAISSRSRVCTSANRKPRVGKPSRAAETFGGPAAAAMRGLLAPLVPREHRFHEVLVMRVAGQENTQDMQDHEAEGDVGQQLVDFLEQVFAFF